MKLKSVRLHNMKRFEDLKVSFIDEFTQKVRDRTVIVGKNGSGKTTLLEVIYWVTWLLQQGQHGLQEVGVPIFSPAGSELMLELPLDGNPHLLVLRTGRMKVKDADVYMNVHTPTVDDSYRGEFDALSDESARLRQSIKEAIAGLDEDPSLGNLLYFPTDRMSNFALKGQLTNERPEFKWAYRYDRNHKGWKGSLESYLCWLYFRDLKTKKKNPNEISKFDEFKTMANHFLAGKQITEVSLDYRVEVEDIESKRIFGLESLSSGEQQIVILIGEIFRHIRKGSIILIDEPEIHLHPVWQRIFVDTLTKLCKKYDAQLILATQSPMIADLVLQREIIQLDDLLEESQR